MLRFSLRALVCAYATLFATTTAFAQTKILNVPDSQVIDTTIRNGPYAAINQNGATLLTRSSTVPEWERRTLINIDTTTIPAGSKVQSAVLTLTLKSGLGTAGAKRPVSVYRVQSPFSETQATWLNRQSGTPWSAPGSDIAEVVASADVTNVAGAKINFNVSSASHSKTPAATRKRATANTIRARRPLHTGRSCPSPTARRRRRRRRRLMCLLAETCSRR